MSRGPIVAADPSESASRRAHAHVEARLEAAVASAPPLPPDLETRLIEIIRSHRPAVDAALARAAALPDVEAA